MNRKILTTANGTIMELTLFPFERCILQRLAAQANIPLIVSNVNIIKDNPFYTDVQVVEVVIRTFYTLLEK